jgi:hypothetical protein
MVKIGFICILLLLLINLHSSSQSLIRSVIIVTGSTSTDNNGTMSYSLGEAVTGSLINTENAITQGFQQPLFRNFYEEEAAKPAINAVEVFPNPVIDNLTILFNIRYDKILYANLFSGRGIMNINSQYSISESGSILIEMGKYPAGLYVLHLYSMDKLIDRVFKIEKM